MAANTTLTLTYPATDVAVLTLDDPDSSAIVLSSKVLDAFEERLNELDARKDLSGLIIRSAKPGMFIAGADLKEFAAWIDAPHEEVAGYCRRGQQLFGRLASSGYVTVAAIDGMCVGGGAELALWCDRRIVTDDEKTAYGFPEVKLGLFPGWGGTARTPRIVGLSNAVELVTGGETVDSHALQLMGLADDVVPASRSTSGDKAAGTAGTAGSNGDDALLTAAIRMVRAEQTSQQFLSDRQRWSGPITISDTELGFLGATASAYLQQQTKGQYPAPLAALEVMLGAAGVDVETACQMEAEEFSKLFGSPVNRALLNVFFLRDRNKKDPGLSIGPGRAAQRISSAGIVGAGIMGQGIGAANVKRGIPVSLLDANPEALTRGVQAILQEVAYNKQTKSADVRRAIELAPLVNGTQSDIELCRSEIIIEAIVESREAKQKLFARLEPLMSDGAILCSNTSTIPITQLATGLEHPEQFCGLHFFNPVRQMPLVEVIRGSKTSDSTIAAAVAYAKSLGKSPIVMNDGPGFLVNRLLLPYMNEAALLLCEGASLSAIERAAKTFGMPMGPFTLYDVVGLDTATHAGRTMAEAFPDRVTPATIPQQLVDAGRLGQKSGGGFFDYGPAKGGKPPRGVESAEVAALIDRCRVEEPRKFSSEELLDRLLLPMLVEATRVIEDGVVEDVRDVDLALIYGIGFPPFLGGLFFWADAIGPVKIVEKLATYAPLGRRYEPTAMLTKLAQSKGSFYD